MSALATLGRGWADPVHGAQQVFRTVLEALSRPGRVQTLPATALQGLEPPALGLGLAATLLTLLDAETSVWLDPAAGGDGAADWLRFHTGVRLQADAATARFAVTHAAQAQPCLWATLDGGTDELPQAGATLLVGVPALDRGPALTLSGPGIQHRQTLQVAGLPPGFWAARQALAPGFPRGVDLILCCGDRLAGLPRSTRLHEEG